MTEKAFTEFIHGLGFTIDLIRKTTPGRTGSFVTVEMGTGRPILDLQSLLTALQKEEITGHIHLVNVKEHPDYGKPYVEVQSLWFDEEGATP